jgi:hypothetical protein
MLKTLFSFLAVLIGIHASAQKTEFRLSLNSGFYSFAGDYAKSTSYVLINWGPSPVTNNPFGTHGALCYGLSGSIQQITKSKFLFGIDFGYEKLRSKVLINEVEENLGGINYGAAAKGKEFLNFDYKNLFPYGGHRYRLGKLSLDLIGGTDIGFCTDNREKSETNVGGKTYTGSLEKAYIKVDIRPRLQISVNYHRLGVYMGYSYGLRNNATAYDDGKQHCYGRMKRFGLAYRL